jgi:hypothetical protein
MGVLQGLTLDIRVHLLRARMRLDNFVMLAILGQMVGVPVITPFYSLRLLPYCLPQIQSWKTKMLRDRDITDSMY